MLYISEIKLTFFSEQEPPVLGRPLVRSSSHRVLDDLYKQTGFGLFFCKIKRAEALFNGKRIPGLIIGSLKQYIFEPEPHCVHMLSQPLHSGLHQSF